MMEKVNRQTSNVKRENLASHVSSKESLRTRLKSGIYNVGTGRARTFKDLVMAIFTSLNLKPEIEFIDTPEDIREKYQYFTEADMSKLRSAGYDEKFFTLEEGVSGYVKDFLLAHKYY